ncbi:Rrf2 family transcriptional regulator [Pusillimonas sp. TS35]|uniref:RrF2 family transcriptional regulator n=1 Tax=Paracandidimonas lactea TaxID=2895524 RepID=UPI00136E17FD|nr:Rrf2 family transcriptional regulator [Paracandidimonas lactea]MYN14602.1 Rrf2 family transcriptional regulator [Pusillimonas sp. TS35]
MRLTSMTDYAMRLLMYVGQHPERLCTIAEIAQAYGISEPHLMKITHRLAQLGWLETIRGKNGGMRLAKAPGAINLGAVVRDIENDLAVVECLGADSRCTLSGTCGLTGIMQGALGAFLRHLDGYTLADIIAPGGCDARSGLAAGEQQVVFKKAPA